MTRAWALPSPTSGVGEPGSTLRSLAIDGLQHGLAAWEVSSPGRTTVQLGEETEPGVWTASEPASGNNHGPGIAAGPGGAAVATWVHAGAGAGVMLRERGRAGSFGPARPFAPGGVEPTVAASTHGEWLLAWCQPTHTGWGVAIARRGADASEWERPRTAEDVVSPDILFANQPRVAVGAGGEAIVTWYQSEGVPLMTYVSERAAAGAFSRPAVDDHLSPKGAPVASDPIANPKAALGPGGRAAVVWVQENGPGRAPVYLATRESPGRWTKPSDLGDSFSEADITARSAQLVFASDGQLYVAWRAGDAIYAARRSPGGTWLEPGKTPTRLSSPGSTAYGVTLAAGGKGGVVAAWVERQGPHEARIAARRTGTGHPDWEPLEWLSPVTGRDVGEPVAAMGESDRTVVGWPSGPPGKAQIVFASLE